MTSPALLTSRSSEWTTPTDLFEALNKVFHFTLDPCASKTNAKCRRYFTQLEDGLIQKWSGRVFMNPPYGRQIGKWVKKAYVEAQSNAETARRRYLHAPIPFGFMITAPKARSYSSKAACASAVPRVPLRFQACLSVSESLPVRLSN